jgi:hypothetical protein
MKVAGCDLIATLPPPATPTPTPTPVRSKLFNTSAIEVRVP